MTNHKLPNPNILARCGICFTKLSFSVENLRFECTKCLVAIEIDSTANPVEFKTVFANSDTPLCHDLPPESFRKARHLRLSPTKKYYFVVFSYLFFPCILPKGHTSLHYFPSSCDYSEESVNYHENQYPVEIPEDPESNSLTD